MNRAKKRNLITFGSILLVAMVTLIVGFLVRGYRLDPESKSFSSTGILSANSVPDGAQVWIDGKLKTATDQTVILSPGDYEVEIKSPGFTTWKKTITIEKEIVAEINAQLFPIAPDLRALTFTGASQPQISPDGAKLVYFVTEDGNPQEKTITDQEATSSAADDEEESKIGLWFINLAEKPLGQSFQPRSLIKLPADFDFDSTTLTWSHDSRKILLTVAYAENNKDYFIIDINQSYDFTVPPLISEKESQALKTLTEWQEEKDLAFARLMEDLPEKLQEILVNQAANITFSPSEEKVLYQANTDISLPEKFITEKVVGISSQEESRQLKSGNWYVYDLEEDKNFLVLADQETNIIWFPTSNHLLLIKPNSSIAVIEYDGHNQTALYSGPFEDTYVFPFPSGEQIMILTSLNSSQSPNIYSISLE
jgi:hypothetical protein